jgi:hypothetical protein
MSEPKRWESLPERVLPEDMVFTQAVDPGADSTPDVDFERYWAAREQG